MRIYVVQIDTQIYATSFYLSPKSAYIVFVAFLPAYANACTCTHCHLGLTLVLV